MSKKDDYENKLETLQLALVRWQQHAMETGEKVLVIFEGRDAAGKDGTIQRVTEYLSVRSTRIVALSKPTDREKSQWYFQRYAPHLPAAGELVIFNRSWYNRAGVERVMGFAQPEEIETFLKVVPDFEAQLVGSGIRLIKLWLDVSRKEQAKRLKERREEPLKILKSSPLDAAATEKFDDYTAARDEMLKRTSSKAAPWVVVCSDDKKAARLNVIKHLVQTLAPKPIAKAVEAPHKDQLFVFDEKRLAALER